MVFSSVPLYLDPPNWQQHPNQQVLQGGGSGGGNDPNQHLIPPPPIPQQPQHQVAIGGGGGGAPSIRPNSMAERARLEKIPPPIGPLKCPRCESTNTKFCYYNNYSLSQPRHFCKACRRYWTHGGNLRNVPVGGGCRRNKRSSGKSSSSGGGGGGGGGGSSSSKSSLSSPSAMMGRERIPPHMDMLSTSGIGPNIPGMPSAGGGGGTGMSSYMASLQNIAQLGMGNFGLTFGGALNAPPHHPLGGFGGPTVGGGGGGSEHHQLDFPQHQLNNPNSSNHHHQQVQFPNFLGGFEIPAGSSAGAGLYASPFPNDHHQEMNGGDHHDHDEQGHNSQLPKSCSSSMMSQLAPVKTEDEAHRLNLAKQFMGISSSNHNNNATSNQYWGANMGNNNNNTAAVNNNMWTDLSGLNSSSSTHPL